MTGPHAYSNSNSNPNPEAGGGPAADGGAIVVTGGASGIGWAVVQRLLRSPNARVAVVDRSVSGSDTGRSADGRLLRLPADVSSEPAMRDAFVAVASEFGSVRGLVTAAGIRMRSTPVAELDLPTWNRVITTNLTGTFVTVGAALAWMPGPGAIVTLSSISGRRARLGQSAYGVSKAGIVHLTKVLSLELAARDIRVNAVCPGVTDTPMIALARTQESGDTVADRVGGNPATFRPGIPLRRVATADEQAAVVEFLLSDAARHVSGQAVGVDGGESVI